MTGTGRAADDVIASLEAQTEATLERLHRASAFREGVEELRGHGASGGTSVVLNASGALVAIDFDDSAGRLSGAELSREVMAAVARAQRDVADQVGARARETWGTDDPVTERMAVQAAGRFGPRLVGGTGVSR